MALDNLSAMILKDLYAKVTPQDFGNIFQHAVAIVLRQTRPGLYELGGAGNPDIVWGASGWEVKTAPRNCPIKAACLAAMVNRANQRLVFLDTTAAPYTLYVCDFTGFVTKHVANGQAETTCTPGREPRLPVEETELEQGLGELLRAVNSALYEGAHELYETARES